MLDSMRRTFRNPAQRLRSTVGRLPERTRRAMLAGIASNRIIVGAYTDPGSGGVCPMLAAHRNGGRTDLAAFAVAWDAFTDARRPRLATRREVRTLRSHLEISLLADEQGGEPVTVLADRIRAERAASAGLRREPAPERAPKPTQPPVADGARIRISRRRSAGELRDRLRWTLMSPARRRGEFPDLIALAERDESEREPVAPRGPAAR